jgi:hypothetical protein
MALSITRDKMAQDSGVNGGAYFTATVKSLAGVQPLHNGPRRHVDEKPPAITPAPIQAVEMRRSVPPVKLPAVKFREQPEKPNPEHLIKGLRFHWRNEGLSGLLTWTEKSVVGINIREIWNQVKELLPLAREAERVDRFLETVQVRMQHQVARAG